MSKIKKIVYQNDDIRNYIVEASNDLPGFFLAITNKITELSEYINRFDKILVLSGISSKLVEATETIETFLIEKSSEGGLKSRMEKDHDIETIVEYCMSVALASANLSKLKPTQVDIDNIYNDITALKFNISLFKMCENHLKNKSNNLNWMAIHVFEMALHLRGQAFSKHWHEVYLELFAPHSKVIETLFQFGVNDILETNKLFNELVFSKVNNIIGLKFSHNRFVKWVKSQESDSISKKSINNAEDHFIRQFLFDNPDLADKKIPDKVVPLDPKQFYNDPRCFWIIPENDTQYKVFKALSCCFGDNKEFMSGGFRGFPLNDSIITIKPIIEHDDKFYCFNYNLSDRNLFEITKHFIKSASVSYFNDNYHKNSNLNSRDNYVEAKVKNLMKGILSTLEIHESVRYKVIQEKISIDTELDLLCVSDMYCILVEVKAGELMQKHKRADEKGLNDRIKDLITKSSEQSARAKKYIETSESPVFVLLDGMKKAINKNAVIFKITVTLETLPSIYANPGLLLLSGTLNENVKDVWIVSLFDLMIILDILETEDLLLLYLDKRFKLLERTDICFLDEIDILELFLDGSLDDLLNDPNDDSNINVIHGTDEVTNYYYQSQLGFKVQKPKLVGS